MSENEKRLRVLISAYACEPGKGSEPGVGWNWALAYRNIAEVWLLTRANNRTVIETWESEHGPTGIHWIFIDAPKWILFIKKKFGRIGIYLYYWYWQWLAATKATEIEASKGPFSWSHQLTMNGFREPGRLDKLNAPLVWGPVGGLQNSDWALSKLCGWRVALFEFLRTIINKLTMHFGWRSIKAVKRRALVIGANDDAIRWIRFWRQQQSSLQLLEIGAPDVGNSSGIRTVSGSNILWVGSDQRIKNPEFALLVWDRLLRHVPHAKLKMVGLSKKRQDELKRWSNRHGIDLQRGVIMRQWLTSKELINEYRRAGQFWFTSFRDTSGNVLLEAFSYGIPCIAFDHQGAAVILGEGRGILIDGRNIEERLSRWCDASRKVAIKDQVLNIPKRPFRSPQIEWSSKPILIAEKMRTFDFL